MPLRVSLSVAVLKIFKTIIFSQAFLISIIFAKSLLPFIDVLLDGILKYIVEPYFKLVWTSLTQYVFVYYISVPIPLILLIKDRLKGGGNLLNFCSNLSVLLILIGLSQAFVLSLVAVSAILQFLDQLISHLLFLIIIPYFNLLRSTLSSWLCVYSSVVLIIFYNVVRRQPGQKDLNFNGNTEECIENVTQKKFCPRQFFQIFSDKLCVDSLSDLCYVLMSMEGGLSLEETEILDKINIKKEKLMKILVILEKKANSQELLVNALKSLIQSSEQRNWYEYLLEKVTNSKRFSVEIIKKDQYDPSTELLRTMREKISLKVFDTIFHVNHENSYLSFGWPAYNDAIKFKLKKGWMTAELIGTSDDIIVPKGSIMVSPVFRVYMSQDAQLELELPHSVRCMSSKTSQLSFAITDNSSMSDIVELKKCELMKSSFSNSSGTLTLQKRNAQPCSYFVGCIVLDQEPTSSDSLITTLAPPPIQYTCSVFYQLLDCKQDLDFRRWRIHIIPHQDLSGFHENILQSHFKQQDYIYGEKTRPLFEMAGPKLSLKVPPNSGSNWLMEQHTTVEDNWQGMKYQHFCIEIQWAGKDRTRPKDFKQNFQLLGTSKKTTFPLFLSPRREYDALLQLHTHTIGTSSLKVLLKKLAYFTKAGIKLDVQGFY